MSQLGADVGYTATYVLPRREQAPADDEQEEIVATSLPEPLLVKNAIWFCYIRWVVVFILASLVVPGVAADIIKGRTLSGGSVGALVMAGILALYNIVFYLHAAGLRRSEKPRGVRLNLWGQIVLDLVLVTAFVHFLGSIETFVSFVYLFHIALAAMLLSRGQSMAVALVACGLYAACVFAELVGLLGGQGYLATHSVPEHFSSAPLTAIANFSFATLILMVMWYLTSELSGKVQARDVELEEANRRLQAALAERAKHMLRTAEELKTPLSAVHANLQLLLKWYLGEFEDYYRTDEAVRHNPQSSGLGLTVVGLVAERHGIEVRVASRLARGTKFELLFPK